MGAYIVAAIILLSIIGGAYAIDIVALEDPSTSYRHPNVLIRWTYRVLACFAFSILAVPLTVIGFRLLEIHAGILLGLGSYVVAATLVAIAMAFAYTRLWICLNKRTARKISGRAP